MKTTLEIPDPLFREVKSKASARGQTLKEFVNQALREKLTRKTSLAGATEPEWMQGFGKLRHLRKETERIQVRIREAFEVVDSVVPELDRETW